MEQVGQDGKTRGAEIARFTVRGGKLYALRGGKEFLLGPAEAAHEAMADHLGQVDFGDR